MMRAAIIALAALLGACSHQAPTSVAGSECKVFTPPPYAVAGRTDYDQDWINETVEGGVGACGWPRPRARPPEIDAPRTAQAPAPALPRSLAPKPKKPGLVKRIKARVWPARAQPIAPVPVPRPEPPPEPPPQPPPPARSAIEELLNPGQK